MTVITAPDTGVLVAPGKPGRRRPSLLIALSILIVTCWSSSARSSDR